MKENGKTIADDIFNKNKEFINNEYVQDSLTASYSYTQIAIMKMLEEYHNWLCKE